MRHIQKGLLLAAVFCCCLTPAWAADKSTYVSSDGECVAAKVTYTYKPDSLFEVHTHMGYLTDITLRSGEKVTFIGGGDTKRWLIDQSSVGSVTHIYIKPLATGIATNLIINTDQHTYRLYIVSDMGNYTPIVEWDFPEDHAMKKMLDKPLPYRNKKEKEFLDMYAIKKGDQYILKSINRNYKIKKHGKLNQKVLPTEVFDDGVHTYIHMPKSNQYDQPTLYRVNDNNKEELVNYRYRDGYFIADRVFTKARLRYSSESWCDIMPADKNELYQPVLVNPAQKGSEKR